MAINIEVCDNMAELSYFSLLHQSWPDILQQADFQKGCKTIFSTGPIPPGYTLYQNCGLSRQMSLITSKIGKRKIRGRTRMIKIFKGEDWRMKEQFAARLAKSYELSGILCYERSMSNPSQNRVNAMFVLFACLHLIPPIQSFLLYQQSCRLSRR